MSTVKKLRFSAAVAELTQSVCPFLDAPAHQQHSVLQSVSELNRSGGHQQLAARGQAFSWGACGARSHLGKDH